MKFRSTRGTDFVSLDRALEQGIAPDGGLYVPESLPQVEPSVIAEGTRTGDIADAVLAPYFSGSTLQTSLEHIIAETFQFPLPVITVKLTEGQCGILELFHGPTAAFKDVGAGFLAACLSRLQADVANPLTILVATSGDTGGAVAAAFDGRPGMRVVVLYPDGRVSDRQAQQLTCWSDNVLSLAVQGSFDDCQRLVKAAMADKKLSARHRFSSANSINIGRLLPQSVYYALTSIRHLRDTGRPLSFVVPTGNLGNALACYLARASGWPVGSILLATNANRIIVDFLEGADWHPRNSIPTHASAMDVGNPSNMERLRDHGGDQESLSDVLKAVSVDDATILDEISRTWTESGMAICPHTATAINAWRNLDNDLRSNEDWVVVSTAHPAKFEQIVEPAIGEIVKMPPALAAIMSRPRRFQTLEPRLEALAAVLDVAFGT